MLESSTKIIATLKGYAEVNELLGAYTESNTAQKAIDEIEILNCYIINLRTTLRANLLRYLPYENIESELVKILQFVEDKSIKKEII